MLNLERVNRVIGVFKAISQHIEGENSLAVAPATKTNSFNAANETEITFEGVEERLATTRFRVDNKPHITVNNEICKECSTQTCVYVCPANLFTPLSDNTILFNYEQCFECGTCYVACNREGAITWTYPRGGYGVSFREA